MTDTTQSLEKSEENILQAIKNGFKNILISTPLSSIIENIKIKKSNDNDYITTPKKQHHHSQVKNDNKEENLPKELENNQKILSDFSQTSSKQRGEYFSSIQDNEEDDSNTIVKQNKNKICRKKPDPSHRVYQQPKKLLQPQNNNQKQIRITSRTTNSYINLNTNNPLKKKNQKITGRDQPKQPRPTIQNKQSHNFSYFTIKNLNSDNYENNSTQLCINNKNGKILRFSNIDYNIYTPLQNPRVKCCVYCKEIIKNSNKLYLSCSHSIHKECYPELAQNYYRCPICK